MYAAENPVQIPTNIASETSRWDIFGCAIWILDSCSPAHNSSTGGISLLHDSVAFIQPKSKFKVGCGTDILWVSPSLVLQWRLAPLIVDERMVGCCTRGQGVARLQQTHRPTAYSMLCACVLLTTINVSPAITAATLQPFLQDGIDGVHTMPIRHSNVSSTCIICRHSSSLNRCRCHSYLPQHPTSF